MAPPADDSLVGRVVGGKFCLRKCIGVGSSGTVYRADQTSLGRTVAVKILRPELACDDRFVRRFNAEALAASRLNHPNVVSVIDFGQTEDGLLYLVMEFLRGCTLTEIIQTEELAPDHISDLMRQVLSALEEAHACGVVHADLKADNIMVEHRRGGWDLVKVVDFGIARLTGLHDEQEDADGTICGTPEYMAPEVIGGLEPTEAADIYAVGVLLYELLVGYTPFTGAGTMEVLRRQIEDAPIPPSEREPHRVVPKVLEQAAMKALNKNPADRFQSAAALSRFLKDRATDSAPSKTILCTECGTTSVGEFKFCPECGARREEAPGEEFELEAEDVGHDEIWADERPTADLSTGEMAALVDDQEAEPASTDRGSILPLPLLGHSRELRQVVDFIAGQDRGVLHLRGERSSGASFLLRKACEEVTAAGDCVIFLSGPDPSGLSTPFYPIRAILAAILELPPLCSYEEIGLALEEMELSKRDQPGVAELFRHEGGGLFQLETPIRKREIFASTIRVLRAAGKQFSAVIAFEDFHLYDQPTQDILRQLAEGNHRSPALQVILTSDDQTEVSWPALRRIDLTPLGDKDLASLVSHFESRGQHDLITVERLRTVTGGHPGHIQQLVRFLIEGGAIEGAPETLADLVASRLDFLPSSARRILQAASIFGMETRLSDLLAMLSTSIGPIETQAAMQLLDARDLLKNQGGIVCFKNGIVREVTYESIPADVRRGLHREAGEILGASTDDPAVLGWHAEHEDAHLRAAELLTRAGDNAVHFLDDLGAASIFSRALFAARIVLLSEQSSTARLRLVAIAVKLADALRAGGELGLAHGVLEEAKEHSQEAPALRAQLLRAEAQIRAALGDIDEAITLYREAIGLAMPLFAADILTDTYLDLGTMQLRNGDRLSAVKELEEGVDIVTVGEGGSANLAPKRFWRILLRLAPLYNSIGKPEKALETAHYALKHALTSKSVIGQARARATLASILESMGQHEKASTFRKRAISDMRALGDRRTTAELLLAGERPTNSINRITPTSIQEARILAEEVGWTEGVRRTSSSNDCS